MSEKEYLQHNRDSWNKRLQSHLESDFYDMKGFLNGANSLRHIELELLGDIAGKSVLHLQCHFGQDTLSMSRMGAKTTGVDLSDLAIKKAKELNDTLSLDAEFICSDIYELDRHLDSQFDIVFSSYGTIGWLPDLKRWAKILNRFLKPGGKFVFVEFHPVVWMFDNDFKAIAYSYFNEEEIIETYTGTYADQNADFQTTTISWNHPLDEVLGNLLQAGLHIVQFKEYPYSPYNCFRGMQKIDNEKFTIKSLAKQIPMTYSLTAIKNL
jgi:SAM-dependent methyltransferase